MYLVHKQEETIFVHFCAFAHLEIYIKNATVLAALRSYASASPRKMNINSRKLSMLGFPS